MDQTMHKNGCNCDDCLNSLTYSILLDSLETTKVEYDSGWNEYVVSIDRRELHSKLDLLKSKTDTHDV